jgi:hypothetical protein
VKVNERAARLKLVLSHHELFSGNIPSSPQHMIDNDLFETLHAHEVEPGELEQLLVAHFGRSKAVNSTEIQYQRDDNGPVMVTLFYDDHLRAIKTGSGLRQDDVLALKNAIQESLLGSPVSAVGRVVLFAAVPTNGHFRYQNTFQLCPVPREAPRPDFLMGEHPLYLEFYYPSSSDATIRIQRRMRRGRELELLCVALISLIHGSLGNTARYHWVIPKHEDPNDGRGEFLQEMYTWPGVSVEATEFTDTVAFLPIARIATNDYYNGRGIHPGQELSIPETIEHYIGSFFSLDREHKDQFLRASYWFQHAQRVFTCSRSASFTALVSAIEALMGPTPRSESCKTCGKSVGPGATKLFVDFVERFAPSPAIAASERRKLYALRSKLSHGGHLLYSDHATWGGGLLPAYLDQWQDMTAMWEIVRIALINRLDTKLDARLVDASLG